MADDRACRACLPTDEHASVWPRLPASGTARRWSIRRAGSPAAPATAQVVARIELNGFYLIQDTTQFRDGKETFATHGVFTYDREDRLYKLFWHDSLGYSRSRRLWRLERQHADAGARLAARQCRHVYQLSTPTPTLDLILAGFRRLADVLSGTYRRRVSCRDASELEDSAAPSSRGRSVRERTMAVSRRGASRSAIRARARELAVTRPTSMKLWQKLRNRQLG